jgi:ankyrin repeat domain-containing protein 50
MQNDALLSDKILEKFEADGEKLIGSFRDLWDILINAAANHNAGEIICILDALDECEDKGQSQIVEALCKLY